MSLARHKPPITRFQPYRAARLLYASSLASRVVARRLSDLEATADSTIVTLAVYISQFPQAFAHCKAT